METHQGIHSGLAETCSIKTEEEHSEMEFNVSEGDLSDMHQNIAKHFVKIPETSNKDGSSKIANYSLISMCSAYEGSKYNE